MRFRRFHYSPAQPQGIVSAWPAVAPTAWLGEADRLVLLVLLLLVLVLLLLRHATTLQGVRGQGTHDTTPAPAGHQNYSLCKLDVPVICMPNGRKKHKSST